MTSSRDENFAKFVTPKLPYYHIWYNCRKYNAVWTRLSGYIYIRMRYMYMS